LNPPRHTLNAAPPSGAALLFDARGIGGVQRRELFPDGMGKRK